MCCFSHKTIKRLGLIISLIFLLAAIVCIILAGVNYKYTDFSFSNFSWKNLGALQLASIIYVIFTSAMGVFTFWCANICVTIIFSILVLISMLFTCAIAIFGLLAGSVDKFESYVGCNSQYTGVLEVWNKVDLYLAEVDTQLCSLNCPCKFNNTIGYTNNTNTLPYYTSWSKSTSGVIKFQECSETVQNQVSSYYNQTSNNTNPINQKPFAEFFGLIETTFNCNGFCKLSYIPRGSVAPVEMYKYMFSDLSNGPPINRGCLKSISDWLPPILKAFGAIALVVTVLQFICFLLAISLCCVKKTDGNDKVDTK